MSERSINVGALLVGIFLVFLGLCWLLANFGLLPPNVWKLWPLILVALGVWLLIQGLRGAPGAWPAHKEFEEAADHQKRGLIGGLVVLFLGLAMLGASLDWWSWAVVGAAPLLAVGLGLIWEALRPPEE
mgnify:CR=1 FL=1